MILPGHQHEEDDLYADLSIYEPSDGSEYRLTDDPDVERTPARPHKRSKRSASSRTIPKCPASDHFDEIPKYIQEKCNFNLDKLPRTSADWTSLLTREEYESKCSLCVERGWPCAVLSGKQTCAGCFAKHQRCNAEGRVPGSHEAVEQTSSVVPRQQKRMTSSSTDVQSSTTGKTPSTSNSFADTRRELPKNIATTDIALACPAGTTAKSGLERTSNTQRMSFAALGRAAADPKVARETLAEIEKELGALLLQQKKYEQLVRMHTAGEAPGSQ